MEQKVTFIVNAKKDYHSSYRCIKSIKRQINNAYDVIVISDIIDFENAVNDIFQNVKYIQINDRKEFAACVNNEIRELQSEYLLFVNYDEIIAPNTVDMILRNSKSDIIVFNISRILGRKFKIRYSLAEEFCMQNYLSKGSTLWNNAIKTSVVKNHSISFLGLSYVKQTLFLLSCYASSEKIDFNENVLFYREKIMNKKPITYRDFKNNLKSIDSILKKLKKKNEFVIRKSVIDEFIVPQLNEYYSEKSPIKRVYKKLLLRKYLGL